MSSRVQMFSMHSNLHRSHESGRDVQDAVSSRYTSHTPQKTTIDFGMQAVENIMECTPTYTTLTQEIESNMLRHGVVNNKTEAQNEIRDSHIEVIEKLRSQQNVLWKLTSHEMLAVYTYTKHSKYAAFIRKFSRDPQSINPSHIFHFWHNLKSATSKKHRNNNMYQDVVLYHGLSNVLGIDKGDVGSKKNYSGISSSSIYYNVAKDFADNQGYTDGTVFKIKLNQNMLFLDVGWISVHQEGEYILFNIPIENISIHQIFQSRE